MGKKKFRLLASAVITVFLFTAVLAGCGANDQTAGSDTSVQSNSSGAQTTVQTSAQTAEKIKLKYFGVRNIPDQEGLVTQMLEEKFNFDIEIMGAPDDQVKTKLNLLLASGDMPDILPVWNIENVRKSGVASFGEDKLKEYMPGIYSYINSVSTNIGRDTSVVWNTCTDEKGVINQIPQTWETGMNPRPVIWRKDMLDVLGKQVPTTIQEMADVFKAYKEKWPDKYPIAGGGKDCLWQCFSEVLYSCGVDNFSWNIINNKIVNGAIQPEVKEVIGILRDWVKAGYISPTWITMTDAEKVNEWNNGNSICINWMNVTFTEPPYEVNSAVDNCAKLNPNATFALGATPVLHEGVKPYSFGWNTFTGTIGFGKHLENEPEKLKRFMEFTDALYSDPELNMLINGGVQDQHWKVNADGMFERMPGASTDDELKVLNIGYYNQNVPANGEYYKSILMSKRLSDLRNEWYTGKLSKDNIKWGFDPVNWGTLTNSNGEDLYKLYKTAFDKKRDEVFASIVSGEKPLDEFDNLVKYYNENGGADMDEAANRLYLKLYVK